MEPLTTRQERVLDTILRFLDAEDRPPTTRELASTLSCHVKTVYQYILALERKGYIERRKGHLRVSPEVRQQHGIPIVGRVAAGVPIMALANREGVLSLQGLFSDRGGLFAVRVSGDSMRDAGILDGDLAVVQHEADVPQGAVAVCYVGDEQEVTVKRLWRRKGGFELEPENKACRPIHVAHDDPDFRIGGKVVGVVRTMR